MATPITELTSLLVARSDFRDGRPCLRGTGITVHAVAAAHLLGFSAEEICEQSPDLEPSLFYAALAYYFANRKSIEAELEADRVAGGETRRDVPLRHHTRELRSAVVFRLYHDEDALQRSLVSALRQAGCDCLTAEDAGNRGVSDEDQLKFATSRERVLFTKNAADFCKLDTRWRLGGRHHAGIVVLTWQTAPVRLQIRAFHALAATFDASDMNDRLEFLLNHAK